MRARAEARVRLQQAHVRRTWVLRCGWREDRMHHRVLALIGNCRLEAVGDRQRLSVGFSGMDLKNHPVRVLGFMRALDATRY